MYAVVAAKIQCGRRRLRPDLFRKRLLFTADVIIEMGAGQGEVLVGPQCGASSESPGVVVVGNAHRNYIMPERFSWGSRANAYFTPVFLAL